ncbi:MAG TPA: flagellar motor switch protein FliN [Paenalcaligenes sp.]|nr:flagellar motor switch protein FliN [Paenalcaligenes sp.]
MTNQKNEPHIEDTPKDTQDELAISWEEALAEQAQGSPDESHDGDQAESAPDDADNIFQPLEQKHGVSQSDIDMIMDIPVQLSVELGRTRLTIKNILQLGQGSVVELDGLAGEPMDVYVNGYLIAQGEVVVVDDKYGIRITDIITPSDRIHRLNTRR